MTLTFKFELISPEEKLVSQDVGMVTLPAEEGAMGVLAGHAPVLTSLSMGVVEVRAGGFHDAKPRRVFVAGGFADIGAAHCTILAEEAVEVSALDTDQLDSQVEAIKAAISVALNDFEKQNLKSKLTIVEAKRAAI
jgi:F-type H+-transporting ATPase subunit epsilon